MGAEVLSGDNRPSAYLEAGSDGEYIIIRASSLGRCMADHVMHLLGFQPNDHPDVLKERFAEGHRAEPIILKQMVEDGWTFVEGSAQREEELIVFRPGGDKPGVKVRYHPDGIASHFDDVGMKRVIEAKALAPSTFNQATSKGTGSLFGYDWQLSVMMLKTGLKAAWVAGPKDENGNVIASNLHYEYVSKPPRSKAEVIKRCKKIRDLYLKGEPPECEDQSQWPCPFNYMRSEKPEVEWADLDDRDAAFLNNIASEYDVLTQVVAAGAKADKKRKELKKELEELAAGRAAIRGGGWEMKTTVTERARMVKSDETYEITTLKVERTK